MPNGSEGENPNGGSEGEMPNGGSEGEMPNGGSEGEMPPPQEGELPPPMNVYMNIFLADKPLVKRQSLRGIRSLASHF